MPNVVGYPTESVTKTHREQVAFLIEDLKASKTLREGREKMWRRSIDQYEGSMWPAAIRDDPSNDLIHIGVSFSTVNTILPHITGRDPVFMIEPVSKDATPKNARIQEAFLNRKWRAIDGQFALEQAAFDYVVYGDGFLKVTYEIIERPISPEDVHTIVEEHVDRVSPWDVWIDPFSEGLHNARWVCIRQQLSEDEARQNQTYNIPKDFEFTDQTPKSDEGRKRDGDAKGGSPHRRWVELFEIYDLTNKILYVIPHNHDKPWKVVEGIDVPLVQIGNHTLTDLPYHFGDLEPIYDVQREIDKTRSQMITHRRRNIAKLLMREDAITSEGKAAMQSGVVGEIVPIKGKDIPLQDLVKEMSLAPLTQDAYAISDISQGDIYEISGITEYQRGASPDITRTATEAQIMQGSSNVKLDAKLKGIERAVRRVGELLLAIAKEVYPTTDVDEMSLFIGGSDAKAINKLQAGEETQQALNEGDMEGAEAIQSTADLYGETIITPNEDIFVGTYEVFVEHASTDAANPQKKADKYRRIFQMLSDLMPMLQQAGIQLDMGRLLRMWLEAEGIPGVDAILAGSPQQMPGMPQDAGLPPDMGMGLPPGMGMAAPPGGAGPPSPPGPVGGGPAPSDADLQELLQQLTGAGITPENSGALDPGAYPNVGR